jgi:CheY-like chemotaxis protein
MSNQRLSAMPQRNASILVVDDQATMREIITQQLKYLGFLDVHTAGNGEEALRLLDSQPFQLVLSDWSMPTMSGLDLLRQVRQRPTLQSLPFVLITAEIQRERVEQAIQAGVDNFLLKPFTPNIFAEKVHDTLNGPAPRNPGGTASARPEGAAATSAAELPTVLVVDDTPNNLTLARGLLQDSCRVKVATSGAKALELCAAAAPDLILLDIMMPEMDGFEVCRRLKADPLTAHIPVIFLTALDDAAKTVAGFELGAVDYVAKPIEPTVLKARVATALRVARAHEELRAQLDLVVENARLREDVERITRHDLKNPLAAIIGIGANLRSGSPLDAEQQRQVAAIEKAAYDILKMIDLSSDLLKMEQGRYRLKAEPVDLYALALRIAEETRQSFQGKGIEVRTELAPAERLTVPGEPLLLYSLLHNLMKNAAEAVPAGATVRLEMTAATADTPCRIDVRNPGAVPAAMRSRFFEKYATQGKEGGTGLGTYSAKLIAEAHAGSIAMQTSEEHGTTVSVSLPG